MQSSKLVQQEFYVRRLNERVVVVRQDAPSVRLARMLGEYCQQIAGEIVHALQTVADVMVIFVTGRRNQKTQMPEVGTVRRRVPRMTAILAPRKQFLATAIPRVASG
jgi:hypothetical protein